MANTANVIAVVFSWLYIVLFLAIDLFGLYTLRTIYTGSKNKFAYIICTSVVIGSTIIILLSILVLTGVGSADTLTWFNYFLALNYTFQYWFIARKYYTSSVLFTARQIDPHKVEKETNWYFWLYLLYSFIFLTTSLIVALLPNKRSIGIFIDIIYIA